MTNFQDSDKDYFQLSTNGFQMARCREKTFPARPRARVVYNYTRAVIEIYLI